MNLLDFLKKKINWKRLWMKKKPQDVLDHIKNDTTFIFAAKTISSRFFFCKIYVEVSE